MNPARNPKTNRGIAPGAWMLGGCVFLFLGAAVVLGSLPRMQWAAVLAAHGGSLLCTVLAGLVLAATLVLAFAGRSRKR